MPKCKNLHRRSVGFQGQMDNCNHNTGQEILPSVFCITPVISVYKGGKTALGQSSLGWLHFFHRHNTGHSTWVWDQRLTSWLDPVKQTEKYNFFPLSRICSQDKRQSYIPPTILNRSGQKDYLFDSKVPGNFQYSLPHSWQENTSVACRP